MRKATIALLAALATMLLSATSVSAHLPPDKTFEVAAGSTLRWDGTEAVGFNVNYFGLAGGDTVIPPGTCSRAILTRCETVLFKLSNPLTQADIDMGKTFKTKTATVSIGEYAPFVASDFDLRAFASDAAGTPFDQIGQSGENPGEPEQVSLPIRTTIDEPSQYVLVHVVYFAVPNSAYKGTATF